MGYPEDNWFSRHPGIVLCIIFALYALVSTLEYQGERAFECERNNQSYNKEQDKCQ